MNIIPQGRVEIMKDIGWDSSYKHVRLFPSDTAQVQYMVAHTVTVVDKCTFVREKSALSVPGDASKYQDCNYLAFANLGFSGKIFYAFIVGVEYVNTDCTRLYIQIDHFQTWLFQMDIGKCFVEREHVSDDTIGKHTVPENLPFGDVCVKGINNYRQSVIPILRFLTDATEAGQYADIFDPLNGRYTDDSVRAALDEYADQPEKIVFLKMGFNAGDFTMQFTRATGSFDFAGDSYTPVNKKLYCYPYCSLTVDDYGTNIETYKWEDFTSPTTATFSGHNYVNPYPISTVTPQNYRGQSSADTYIVVKTDFPECPYPIDNFRAWQSSVGAKQNINLNSAIDQTIVADVSGLVSALTGAGTSIATENLSGLVGSINNYAAGYVSRGIELDRQRKSNAVDKAYSQTHGISIGGQFGGNMATWIAGNHGWRICSYMIKPEYARMIDEFFTRFGYKVNRYKKPNINSRTTFNYVKTVDCHVGGNIPNEASTTLEGIFNSGVTIWHTNEVAVFDVSNEPTGVENE